MTAPEQRQQAFVAALAEPDDGIPIVEAAPDDTAVTDAGQLAHLRAESTPPPRGPLTTRCPSNEPPKQEPPAPVVESSEYERALGDVRAVLLEDIAMPPQAVDLYLELARKREGRR